GSEQTAAAPSADEQAQSNAQWQQRPNTQRGAPPLVIDLNMFVQLHTQSTPVESKDQHVKIDDQRQDLADTAASTAVETQIVQTQTDEAPAQMVETQQVSTSATNVAYSTDAADDANDADIKESADATDDTDDATDIATADTQPKPSVRKPLLDEQQQQAFEAAGLQWVQTRSDYSYEAFHLAYFQRTEVLGRRLPAIEIVHDERLEQVETTETTSATS